MSRHTCAFALDDLLEACELQQQGHLTSGLVTPSTPGGQNTAYRRDGTPVDRVAFMQKAMASARHALGLSKAPVRETTPTVEGVPLAPKANPYIDLLRAAMEGKTVQMAIGPGWGVLSLEGLMRHAVNGTPLEKLRVKPEILVKWAVINVSVGSGAPDPWLNGYDSRQQAVGIALGHQKAVVLRLELDADTLAVIDAMTEAP